MDLNEIIEELSDKEVITRIRHSFMKYESIEDVSKKKDCLAKILNITKKKGVHKCVAVVAHLGEAVDDLEETKNYQLIANICLEHYLDLKKELK